MKQRQRKRLKRRHILAVLFLLCLSLPWTLPLGIINRFLPNTIRLVEASGTLSHGQWQAVNIEGKNYPLDCRYNRQGTDFSGVDYAVDCQSPLIIAANFRLQFNGDFTVSDGKITGELSRASSWFKLLGMPMPISGNIDISLSKASIESQVLTHLDIRGESPQINLVNTPILHDVRLETRNAQLSDSMPISLSLYTDDMQSASKVERIKLQLETEIDGRAYASLGEISGAALSRYARILRLLAQETQSNHFVFALQGTLF